jgi:hypothetical protein
VYCGLGVLHGVVLTVLIFVCYPQVLFTNGKTGDLEILGTSVYITLIIAVLIQIFLETHCFTLVYCASQMLSLVFLMIFIIVLNYTKFTDTNDLIGVGTMLHLSPYAMFSIIFLRLCVLFRLMRFICIKNLFFLQ